MHHLTAAIREADAPNEWRMIGFGNRRPISPDLFPIPTTTLGRIESQSELASLYSAADLFACPSREDNLPNTMLESLACGTPVVGFDVGGIPDFVRPGMTGALAQRYDLGALAKCLRVMLEQDEETKAAMRRACREVAVHELSPEHQALRYMTNYREILNSRSAAAKLI